MTMMRWIGLSICLLLFSPAASAINALFSYSVFYLPESGKEGNLRPYAEVYWQIDPQTLRFTKTETQQWQAGIQTELILSTDTGEIVHENFTLQTPLAATSDAAFAQRIMDMHRYLVSPGKIKIELHLTDAANTTQQFHYIDSFVVPAPVAKSFYSSLKLIDTSYYSANDKSAFYKMGRMQIPLATNFLDDDQDILHFYTELNYVAKLNADDGPFIQHVYIARKPGDPPVLNRKHSDTIKGGNMLPVSDSFHIVMLPTGNYNLIVSLINKHGVEVAGASAFFQRINTVPAVQNAVPDTGFQKISIFDLSETFAGNYTVAQLRAILKMLLPIATPIEQENIKGFLKKPDETYMRYFVYNFWNSRNSKDPKKDWEQYSSKVKEANRMFGASTVPGYESDRGIVYLKYGKPNERIVVNNETGSVPYEVWTYNAPGKQGAPGAFLFYQTGSMISSFELLHTTVIGEKRNPQWRMFLYSNGAQAPQMQNFRAEQYFK